jgi:hypothetical protein
LDQTASQQGTLDDKWVLKPNSLKDANLNSFKLKETGKSTKVKITNEFAPVTRNDESVGRHSANLQNKQKKALQNAEPYQYNSDLKKRKRREGGDEEESEKRIRNSKKSVPVVKRKKKNVEEHELDEDSLERDTSEEDEEEGDYDSEDEEDDYFDDE